MTALSLPETEASRILHVDSSGLAHLVRAGHLNATLASDGYRFASEQVHALQPQAGRLVKTLEKQVEERHRARSAEQLEQAKALGLTATLLGGASVALLACVVAPAIALPLIAIGGMIFALGMPSG